MEILWILWIGYGIFKIRPLCLVSRRWTTEMFAKAKSEIMLIESASSRTS